MKLDNAIVLVTGANRGLGEEFARQALARSARKVYAGARDPATVKLPGVVPVRLDVNDPAQVHDAAALEEGQTKVLVDELSWNVKRGLSQDPGIYLDVVQRPA